MPSVRFHLCYMYGRHISRLRHVRDGHAIQIRLQLRGDLPGRHVHRWCRIVPALQSGLCDLQWQRFERVLILSNASASALQRRVPLRMSFWHILVHEQRHLLPLLRFGYSQ